MHQIFEKFVVIYINFKYLSAIIIIMIARTVMPLIENYLANKPVTLITGARQTGKTFICRDIAGRLGYRYVTLADRQDRALANSDPESFLQMYGHPLIIDEVQKAPVLFDAIEGIVDKAIFSGDGSKGMYVLTGSQSYRLMEGVSQSMSGRVGIVDISPLSISEIRAGEEMPFSPDLGRANERCDGRDSIAMMDAMVAGGYPELHNGSTLSSWEFYSDYVDSYIARDVMEIINLKDQLKFFNFMQVMASMTGQELVGETVCKAVGINMRTFNEWLSVLVVGGIIHLLQPYNGVSTVKRVSKRPKMYFTDTGLACYLSRIADGRTLSASYLKGPMAETYIVNEIMKTYTNRKENVAFYHYRDTSLGEIDLLIQRNGTLSLVECKAGVDITKEDTGSIRRFAPKDDIIESRCVVCLTSKPYVTKDGIPVIPASSI